MIRYVDIYVSKPYDKIPVNYIKHNVLFFLRSIKIPKLKKVNFFLSPDYIEDIKGEGTSVCNVYYSFNPSKEKNLYSQLVNQITLSTRSLLSFYKIENEDLILNMQNSLLKKELNKLEVFKSKRISKNISCGVFAEFTDLHTEYFFKLNKDKEVSYNSFFKCHSRCSTSNLFNNFYIKDNLFVISDDLNQVFFTFDPNDIKSKVFISPKVHNENQIRKYINSFSPNITDEEYLNSVREYLNW